MSPLTVAPAARAARDSSPVAPAPIPDPGEDSVAFAHRVLRAAILDGSLPAGAAVSQVRLAADLGISRTPLREAIGRLMAEGLVTGDFNRQVRVAGLDLADLDQVYAMRLALEPLAITATVPALDAGARRALAEHVDAMDEAVRAGDMAGFRSHHRGFHLGLTAGGGARLCASLATLFDHSERYRRAYLHEDARSPGAASRRRLELSQTEHRAILDAALAGGGAECADLQVAHMRRTVEVVFLEASALTSGHLVRQVTDQPPPTTDGRDHHG